MGIPKMTSAKLILPGVFVAIFLFSFDSVKSDCDCEGPVVDNCCPVGFNGQCCEYPLARTAKSGSHLSPLEKQLKQLDDVHTMPKGIPEDRTLVPPPKEGKLLKQLDDIHTMPKEIPEDRTLVPPPKEEKLLKQLEERKDYTVNP